MIDLPEKRVSLTGESLTYLKETSGWGTFLAIVGFCYVALLICLGLFAGSIFGAMAGEENPAMGGAMSFIMGGVYVAIGVLYIFPSLYLYRFSQEVKNALSRNNTEALTKAMGNLKSLFKFLGILTAIGIGLMILAMLSVGAGSMFG